jgi:hypothetical protein
MVAGKQEYIWGFGASLFEETGFLFVVYISLGSICIGIPSSRVVFWEDAFL